MDKFSFLNTISLSYIEKLYKQYIKFPNSIDTTWKNFFQGYDFANECYNRQKKIKSNQKNIVRTSNLHDIQKLVNSLEQIKKEFKITNLINSYRQNGHLFIKKNPIKNQKQTSYIFDIEKFGLKKSDLKLKFSSGKIIGIQEKETLENIVKKLNQMYCNTIGIEYMFLHNTQKIKWIQNWINKNYSYKNLSQNKKIYIFKKIVETVKFEEFLHIKFVGKKRFSLEGSESLIPALDELIKKSAKLGVKEIVIGMAHRGRLNVLYNILKKSLSQIFSEFEDKDDDDETFSGDVKYHLGLINKLICFNDKTIQINLIPNPSHLEAVNPIVYGITRAKSDLIYKNNYNKILPILIHGDAAITGQGIMYETMQMMNLDGYRVGGTIHIIINNQIGFTTDVKDLRSSTYCTDIAKMTLSPILHVNGEDIEAVIHCIRFAVEFRFTFQTDIFIDLIGYRKYGHNEGDEPKFTQPKLYNLINKYPNLKTIYGNQLLEEKIIDREKLELIEKEYTNLLEEHFQKSKKIQKNKIPLFIPHNSQNIQLVNEKILLNPVNTSFSKNKLIIIGKLINTIPNNKQFIKKTIRLIERRLKMIESEKIDWGLAELLAYGSILYEGRSVRISGEDVERGTFSHRHAVITNKDTEEKIILLNQINTNQGVFRIYNSHLSEYGVLGFDYGYAMASPDHLTIWEAQFGDFANGAQIIIDQYITSAEDKWKIQNGIVILLPHGSEGQGSEHSSGRIERFLQLCANGNIFVINPSTPANFFHFIRRQIIASYRKPLIIMTPKSLLRHPQVISNLDELSNGEIQEVIDDVCEEPKKIKRLILCSGKLYYELIQKKEKLNINSIAIIRIEQIYPLHQDKLYIILNKYPQKKEIFWVQEEPENMGSWWYIFKYLKKINIKVIAPQESPTPAPGSYKKYQKIQNNLIDQVFANL